LQKVRVLLALLFGMAVLFGCEPPADPDLSPDERKAISYLAKKKYKIIERLGERSRYVLEREMLSQLYYSNIWAVQRTSPEPYIGKTIVTYGFIVTNHPLEKLYSVIWEKDEFDVEVIVMLSEGQVIGGTSFPVLKSGDLLVGAPYSLDGKDLTEITGMSYGEWLEAWKARYGDAGEQP